MAQSDEQVDAVRRHLADLALKALLFQMSGLSNAWWFQGASVQKNRDGTYFLLAKINPKAPLDETGWPYGLPQDSNGVKVRSDRTNPSSYI